MKDQKNINFRELLRLYINDRRKELLENMYNERTNLADTKMHLYNEYRLLGELYKETQRYTGNVYSYKEDSIDRTEMPVLIQLTEWLSLMQSDLGMEREEARILGEEIKSLKNIIVRVNGYLARREFFPKELEKITPLGDYDMTRNQK